MSMFCFQCEQTHRGKGCVDKGVCGKDATTAALQDLLVHVAEAVSQYAHRAREYGKRDPEIDVFVLEALFVTVTNVSFDPARVEAEIRRGVESLGRARALYEGACSAAGKAPEVLTGPAAFEPGADLAAQGTGLSITKALAELGPDVAGLQELIKYGVKGMAAYACHARNGGIEKDSVYAFVHEALSYLASSPSDVGELTAMALRVGEVNLEVMSMLDEANTTQFGHPEPTEVRISPVKGKSILVSGHELDDLHKLLQQSAGKGVNVYTHGEMLPCLAYPELKKFPHLVGNYGGAWQDQAKEFEAFPGAILMTTNCIQEPRPSYNDRIFTTGLVSWPGVSHVERGDFSAVIEAALNAPGFEADAPEQKVTIGFARNTVLGVADKVIEAVKGGQLRHFFVVGGCDGARPGRNYYTDLTEQIPDDCAILTLGCGKFRFNKREFGDIGGIPRLLDMGQCNDAYSAIQVAVALADAFGCGVNDLPLSIVLSWYEQKAVCVLLSLLHLGIQNMRIGPSLPAFIGPEVLKVLVENFGLAPVKTAEEDLAAMLG